MPNNQGALPDSLIHEMIETGFVKGAKAEHVGPASLDLCVSDEVYRVSGMFLPRKGESIRSLLGRLDARRYDIGATFEKDVTYLVRMHESLALPQGVYGYCNPKSSTGRHDVHVRVLADGVSCYDAAPTPGFSGELWATIVPRSYSIVVPFGEPLSQLRFFNADTRLSKEEIEMASHRETLLFTLEGEAIAPKDVQIHDNDNSIILTLDFGSEIAGYEYTGQGGVLDFSKGKKAYDAQDFFAPVKIINGRIYLRRGGFYILSTAEAVRIPPYLACEMTPMSARSGEFRAHYAGFIDPGWGYGKDGEGKGRPLTLEVRPYEDLVIAANQPIAEIKLERMSRIPDLHYDAKEECNYGTQSGPKLAKHFK